MVERPKIAPPAVQTSGVIEETVSGADQSSISPGKFAEYWPPGGWPMFACVTKPSGTVTGNDRDARGDLPVLKYEVRHDQDGVYTIEIFKGTLNRTGEMGLKSALSIRFSGREDWYVKQMESGVHDLNVDGKAMIPERGLILRHILATTYLISRIDRGLMPNLKKTLKIYRLD